MTDQYQKIDFLPANYLLQRKRGKQLRFRMCACAAVLLLCLLGTYGQQSRIAGLQKQKQLLTGHLAQLRAQLGDVHKPQQQLTILAAKTNLLSQLKMRTSVSRLLAAITDCRPEHVSLNSLTMESKQKTNLPVVTPNQKQSEQKTKAAELATTKDLQSLEQHSEKYDLIIQLTGVAPDDVAISAYLESLEQCGLMQNVRLVYTDHYPFRDIQLRKFVIELIVRKPKQPDPGLNAHRTALSKPSSTQSLKN